MFSRSLALEQRPKESFLLWGPRQVGKSALLHATYPSAVWLDLLKDRRVHALPAASRFCAKNWTPNPPNGPVIVDEVQKLPALLDEIHWLIEIVHPCSACADPAHASCGADTPTCWAVGRSATSCTVSCRVSFGRDFELLRALNHGGLPRHYLAESPSRLLAAYVDDYLKEEVASEGLVRNLPAFADFLNAAALADTNS